jgi:hypothetical protein
MEDSSGAINKCQKISDNELVFGTVWFREVKASEAVCIAVGVRVEKKK